MTNKRRHKYILKFGRFFWGGGKVGRGMGDSGDGGATVWTGGGWLAVRMPPPHSVRSAFGPAKAVLFTGLFKQCDSSRPSRP